MEKVTGIGGIFIKADNPLELQKWYEEKLGFPAAEDGPTIFEWREADAPEQLGQTAWSLFPRETTYFDPSRSSCMINYRVENLGRMLVQLREAGVTIVEEMIEEYGSFAWVLDPEGSKIELWEAPKTA